MHITTSRILKKSASLRGRLRLRLRLRKQEPDRKILNLNLDLSLLQTLRTCPRNGASWRAEVGRVRRSPV